MKIGNIDLDSRVLVIAEIGNNHEGDPSIAMEMVDAAAEAGVDAVKVQVIDPEHLVNRNQIERIAQLKRYQLSMETFADMAALAKKKGILFIASAFDLVSQSRISELTCAIKIASGDLTYQRLLGEAALLDQPIILSTGMSTIDEVRVAIETIAQNLPLQKTIEESVALLHCVSLYPTPAIIANIKAMQTLRANFNLNVGYSDHTLGIEVATLALALGARIIEKHFTLDKTRTSFRDHALSADPEEIRRLAEIAHHVSDIMGDGKKVPSPEEREMIGLSRRGIVAARELQVGDHLTIDDIAFVRPQIGFSSSEVDQVLGKKLKCALSIHEALTDDHIE